MNALWRWLACRAAARAIEAHLDGDRPRLTHRVERHLRDCPRCRAMAEALSAQARLLEQLSAEDEPPAGFVHRVMERIARAETAGGRRHMWRPALAVGAAAVAALALLLWLVVGSGGPAEPPQRTARPGSPTVQPYVPGDGPAPQPPAVAAAPLDVEPPAPAVAAAPPVEMEPPAPAVAKRPAQRRRSRAPRPAEERAPSVEAPATAVAVVPAREPSAEDYRAAGRFYEAEGMLAEALAAYAAARDEAGSGMARMDAARAYEKWGYTAEALDELMVLAFAPLDEDNWETLTVR